MDEFFPALLVVSVGTLLAGFQAVRLSRRDAPVLLASFAAHIFAALMQVRVALALWGGGDFFAYSGIGAQLGRLLSADFQQFAPEMLKLVFWQMPQMPIDTSNWAGSSTGAMMGLSGFLSYLFGGGIYTLCIAVAVWGYFGQVALYRGLRMLFPDALHPRLLVATLLVPSAVYWSSALLKESVAITGMGYVFLGFVQSRQGLRIVPVLQILGGAVVVALFKTYILFALILAVGAWLFCESERRTKTSATVQFVVGAAVALAGIALLTQIFPEFSISTFANRAAFYQEVGQEVRGDSTYSMGDYTRTTLGGQLAFSPVALLTSLYRPFPFEAKSAQVAVAAFESTLFLLLTIRAVNRRSVRGAWRLVSTSPPLAFCLVFTVFFGVGVGLTTTNLGTLSRYRMPLIPFFIALLLVLDAPYFAQRPVIAAPQRVLRPRRRPIDPEPTPAGHPVEQGVGMVENPVLSAERSSIRPRH